jgi:hypothetical protein
MYLETTWSINSLDLILGLVGGFTSIIWSFLGLLIAPYEDFKFQNSVAGNIYPTSPQKDEDEREHDNAAEAKWHLEDTIKERGKFSYKY